MSNSDINDTDALFNGIYKKKKEKEENKLKTYIIFFIINNLKLVSEYS